MTYFRHRRTQLATRWALTRWAGTAHRVPGAAGARDDGFGRWRDGSRSPVTCRSAVIRVTGGPNSWPVGRSRHRGALISALAQSIACRKASALGVTSSAGRW